jgi:hypothetical protein
MFLIFGVIAILSGCYFLRRGWRSLLRSNTSPTRVFHFVQQVGRLIPLLIDWLIGLWFIFVGLSAIYTQIQR